MPKMGFGPSDYIQDLLDKKSSERARNTLARWLDERSGQFEFPTEAKHPAKPAHVAGLDAETIDQDAYREFMRSM
jgi:hypothetical protein